MADSAIRMECGICF